MEEFEEFRRQNARLINAVRFRVAVAQEAFDKRGDAKKLEAMSRRLRNSGRLIKAWNYWAINLNSLMEIQTLFSDPQMEALAEEEQGLLIGTLENVVTNEFTSLLVPPSTLTDLSALIELKSGVGGSESSLFLADLLRMYVRHANSMGWTSTVLASNESDNGGIKDAILEIKGENAYDWLRWESGVHRVQRVPATEASGRVHTSTVAAVVLPLSEEPELERSDDLFNMEDIRLEVMRARGAGGQHVNKTESAVRLTHIPTGITVSMQDERSQHQNRRRAFQVLRARLTDQKLIREQAERRAARKSLVRTADRSEKIRTYNYPKDRVTDHRLAKMNCSLNSVMEEDGLLSILIELGKWHRKEVLEDVLAECDEFEGINDTDIAASKGE
ncbi:hypothetical protein EW146_g7981 [Bondarzewia mesenterica]|uniref:Prokaryotic-type class I peptide chain release factors domain-containing protein n=1 Tax=Bondarzewia mesenterica TaxID=1095465 RepID=A0A4V3XDZ1_9AGAM|nr:hypothetical protein EW146_g7981 [Bondarzewia mesenterica]